jgi:hypothetical protein
MLKQIELFAKYAPAVALISLVIGGVYNIGVMGGAGQLDLLYLLTYLDHINSAVMSSGSFLVGLFILYGIGWIVAPIFSRAAQWLRLDRLKVRIGSRPLAAVILLLFFGMDQLRVHGVTPRLIAGQNVAFIFFLIAGILIVKYFAHLRLEHAVLATLFAIMAAFGLGLAWIPNARESTSPYFYIEAGDRIVAKGVKAFSEYALVVDHKGAVLAIRNSDIKKITIGHEPPPGFAAAPAAGSKP